MLAKSPTIQLFDIRASKLHQYALWLVHSLAVLAVFLTSLSPIVQLALATIVIVSCLSCKQQPNTIRYNPAIGWQYLDASGDFADITIAPSSICTKQLIVLHFASKNKKKRTLVVATDCLSPDNYRLLQVALKIHGINYKKPNKIFADLQ